MIYPIQPTIFKAFPHLLAIQTTREGGVSTEEYASLNLGLSSGDQRENVLKNRALLWNSLEIQEHQVVLSSQVHGESILHAKNGGLFTGYDALITGESNLFLAISIADCAPILIYDQAKNCIAAIHSGWRGTTKKVLFKTLINMHESFGSDGKNCFAFIGACISEKNFEVDQDVADQFENPYKRYDPSKEKFFVDLKKANYDQLKAFGIPDDHIEISPDCTFELNHIYYSYRYSKGKTGRMFAIIGLR